ncbi:heavy metal-binding domain-containing protein [Acidithiobacillus thiooxidans]|uniref:heavy metal-binding domain-containing protein n=1 Tax=Acidithiobacillus thiooxidans TaxID=930 RepID=UPI001C07E532|nr:heavy metal-binding domain-containing protein [Acidithiobacillus thiooxidans]MBU2840553.1 heavy metal-binding domain-containing protein [Acidithiobacillus thiooxidans]
MKTEPVEAQKTPFSTTDSIQESPNTQIITVMNRAYYGECFSRQPDDTLDMLQEKARTLGAKAVIGVRLVPMVDERGIRVMMAYGTAVTKDHG